MRNGRSGADRNRTGDLLNAIQALSQLSYGPTGRTGGRNPLYSPPPLGGQRNADPATRSSAAPFPGDRPGNRPSHGGRRSTLPEGAARGDRRAVHAHLVVEVST